MPSDNQPGSGTQNSLIYNQIEQGADLYPPLLYANLLSFWGSFTSQTEELSYSFLPASPTLSSRVDFKLMAIGILPPSANVTGRQLDRSSSVAAASTTGAPASQVDIERLGASSSGSVAGANGLSVSGTPGSNGGPPVQTQLTPTQVAAAISAAYQKKFGTLPTQTELAIYTAQSFRETSGNWPNYNPGFIGNYKNPPANQPVFGWQGTTGTEYYNSYPTAQAGANSFLNNIVYRDNGAARTAAMNGDIPGYVQALHDGGYFTATTDQYLSGFYSQNIPGGSVQNLAQMIGDPSKLSTSNLPPPINLNPSDPANTAWSQTGASSAQTAAQQNQKASQGDLNLTPTGQMLQAAQQKIINAMQNEMNNLYQTPPLKMLVNPQSFKPSSEKIVSDSAWGRSGPIVEHWGEQQDKISASGKIAGFYSQDIVNDPNTPGLGRTVRAMSQSYQNILSLWLFYRNNGGLYLNSQVTGDSSQRANLATLGSIYIYYDNTLYIGSFDSFTMSETDTEPFTLEYSYEFSVRATFLLDVYNQDPYTYGSQVSSNVQSPGTIKV